MLPPRLLIGTQRSYSIDFLLPTESTLRDLAALPDARKLMRFTLPTWQRDAVWTLAQQGTFIEGIFLGFGCGQLVTNGKEWTGADDAVLAPMSGWLLDGQQRVTAIRDFIQDSFPVFDGLRWSDLTKSEQTIRFWNQPFPHFELEYIADEAVLKSLYTRLNFGGTAHTPSDRARLDTL